MTGSTRRRCNRGPEANQDQAAMKRAEQLWHAASGSTDADALDILTLRIADYETRHIPIAERANVRYPALRCAIIDSISSDQSEAPWQISSCAASTKPWCGR